MLQFTDGGLDQELSGQDEDEIDQDEMDMDGEPSAIEPEQ